MHRHMCIEQQLNRKDSEFEREQGGYEKALSGKGRENDVIIIFIIKKTKAQAHDQFCPYWLREQGCGKH